MSEYPFVSIIIPVLNAEKYIKQCLVALSNLDYPIESREIVVADAGSADNTAAIAEKFGARIVMSLGATVAGLRNLGAASAKGDILGFIDADCLAPVNWLKDAVEMLGRADAIGAAGAEYALPESPRFIEQVWDLQIEARRHNGEVNWLPSGNIMIKRAAFAKIAGFNEALITNEDVDFCDRLKRAGYRIVADEKIAVRHIGNPKNTFEFLRKEIWRGKGAVQSVLNSLPGIKLNKAFAFGLFMLVGLLALLIGVVEAAAYKSWWLSKTALGLLFLPSLVISVKTVLKKNRWQFMFPLAYLYFIYGLARAVSILDFGLWKRQGDGR